MDTPYFTVVLRGYDRAAVDELVGRAEAALTSPDESLRAEARAALRTHDLPVRWRGYDRGQVDTYFARTVKALEPGPA